MGVGVGYVWLCVGSGGRGGLCVGRGGLRWGMSGLRGCCFLYFQCSPRSHQIQALVHAICFDTPFRESS